MELTNRTIRDPMECGLRDDVPIEALRRAGYPLNPPRRPQQHGHRPAEGDDDAEVVLDLFGDHRSSTVTAPIRVSSQSTIPSTARIMVRGSRARMTPTRYTSAAAMTRITGASYCLRRLNTTTARSPTMETTAAMVARDAALVASSPAPLPAPV